MHTIFVVAVLHNVLLEEIKIFFKKKLEMRKKLVMLFVVALLLTSLWVISLHANYEEDTYDVDDVEYIDLYDLGIELLDIPNISTFLDTLRYEDRE